MKSYEQNKVNPDIPGVIILSHGGLAVGLVNTAQMLFGESENVAAFSLEGGDDIDEYRNAFAKTLENFPKDSIVLADLYGGTPCNQALQYAQESGRTFELVTGVNLPMFLNVIIQRETAGIKLGKEFTTEIMKEAKSGISRVDVAAFLAEDEDEDDE